MTRRYFGLLILPIAGLLVDVGLAPSAQAALCIRLRLQPPALGVGARGRLELRTFFPLTNGQSGLRLEPGSIPSSYPFRVEAVGQGQALRFKIHRSDDPQLWVGFVSFPRAGTWEVRVLNFELGGLLSPACYSRLHVMVGNVSTGATSQGVSSTSSGRTALVLWAVLSGLAASTVGVVLWLRRRRRQPS